MRDPELRAKLTPHYRFGCKRPILSNTYYPALRRANVELVTEPIERVDERAIVTADGVRHEVDTIITAIGYRYNRSLLVDRDASARAAARSGEVWDARRGPTSARRCRASRTCSSCSVRTRSGSTR